MLNPSQFFHLLGVTSIPDLTSDTNQYRDVGIVSLEIDTFDHKCYVTYEPKSSTREHSSFIFVFIYNTYNNKRLDDVYIDTFEICDNIITDDLRETFDLNLNCTEEVLFQLSTVSDTLLTLEDIEQFKEQLDAVREMFYNHYPEIEFT